MAKDILRLPPQNLDAERGVLGSVLLMNEAIDEVGESLRAEHFYHDSHHKIYAAVHDLYENNIRGIDPVTLAEELEKRGELEEIGGAAYIIEILDSVPHAAHVRYYAGIVREKWMQRTLISTCTEILSECYEPEGGVDELLQASERKIFSIVEQQEDTANMAIGEILMEAFTRIDERINKDGSVSGVTTGFTDLDHQTTGLHPAELLILAARPSMGKTAFVCNIAEAIARVDRKGVMLFSLEQSNLELAWAVPTWLNNKIT